MKGKRRAETWSMILFMLVLETPTAAVTTDYPPPLQRLLRVGLLDFRRPRLSSWHKYFPCFTRPPQFPAHEPQNLQDFVKERMAARARVGMALTICVSLSAAFDVALVGAPLAAATVSSKLRRSLAPRSLPLNSNLLCLRWPHIFVFPSGASIGVCCDSRKLLKHQMFLLRLSSLYTRQLECVRLSEKATKCPQFLI